MSQEFMIDLDGPTLASFTELVKEHCRNLVHEFFSDFEQPAEISEKDKTMAILALVAANAIRVSMHEIITDMTSMPEMISDYVVASSETTGNLIAQELKKEFSELSFGDSLLHLVTVPGGEA